MIMGSKDEPPKDADKAREVTDNSIGNAEV
jgi:hypothetical protein